MFSKGFPKGKKRDRMAGQKSAPEGRREFHEKTHTFQILVNRNKIPKIPKFKNLTLKCPIKFGQGLTPPPFLNGPNLKDQSQKCSMKYGQGLGPPPLTDIGGI